MSNDEMASKRIIKVTTQNQFDTMVDFMEGHIGLACGYHASNNARESTRILWDDLCEILNEQGPPVRTSTEWRKVWGDYKQNIKKKIRNNKKLATGTGGDSNKEVILAVLEERVNKLCNLSESATSKNQEIEKNLDDSESRFTFNDNVAPKTTEFEPTPIEFNEMETTNAPIIVSNFEPNCDESMTNDSIVREFPLEKASTIQSVKERKELPLSISKSKKAKTEETNSTEAFKCMRSLIELVAIRDEYTVYGEHIAYKLKNCGRSKLEVEIAQHEINNICFKLTMGEFSHLALSYPHSLPVKSRSNT